MKSSRTGCRQCRDVIETLEQQIKQLQHRQHSLKQLNQTLIENISIPMGNNQQQTVVWKQKYEEQVQRSCRLQRQLMEIQIQQEIQRRSQDRKRQSVNKLNHLIMSTKLQGIQNDWNFGLSTKRSAKKSFGTDLGKYRDREMGRQTLIGKKELVVRIVR